MCSATARPSRRRRGWTRPASSGDRVAARRANRAPVTALLWLLQMLLLQHGVCHAGDPPPSLIPQGLDSEPRGCSGPLTGEVWGQAGLCTSEGGLGIRHVCLHANAAHVASLVVTASLCREIDPHHTFATLGILQLSHRRLQPTCLACMQTMLRFQRCPTSDSDCCPGHWTA